jgi:hypothetical protein
MHTEPRAAPHVLPDKAVPGGGRGRDLAKPLGEDGERAGRYVTIFGEVTISSIARTSGRSVDTVSDTVLTQVIGLVTLLAISILRGVLHPFGPPLKEEQVRPVR